LYYVCVVEQRTSFPVGRTVMGKKKRKKKRRRRKERER
jgi:hypothetical protein